MIKKILLMTLVLSVQANLNAINYQDAEELLQGLNTTIKIGDTNFFINESGVVTAQKEAADRRKILLLLGGIAVTSLVVGGVAAGLYYYVKLDTLSKKIDAAKNAEATENAALEKRLSSVMTEAEKLKNETDDFQDSYDYRDEKNEYEYKYAINSAERELFFDVQVYKTNKKINDISLQMCSLCTANNKEDLEKYKVLDIDKDILRLELEVLKHRLIDLRSDPNYLQSIEAEKNKLKNQRAQLEKNVS